MYGYCPVCMGEINRNGCCGICGYPEKSYEAQPHHLPIGTKIGRVQIGGVIGEGGFGIVYAGLDLAFREETGTNVKVAVKEYYPRQSVERNHKNGKEVRLKEGADAQAYLDGLADFKRLEAANLAKFQNMDGMASIYGLISENNTAYIVMGFAEGEDLKTYISRKGGRIRIEEALDLLAPVGRSVADLHNRGYIHGDISLHNIIQKNGKSVLIDFGSCRKIGERNSNAALKHGYAPLERYDAHIRIGAYMDVYAFCGVLYHMITGECPPHAKERAVKDHLVKPSKKGAAIDRYTERVLMRGLAVSAADRYQTMEQLLHDLYKRKRNWGKLLRMGTAAVLAGGVGVWASVLLHGRQFAAFAAYPFHLQIEEDENGRRELDLSDRDLTDLDFLKGYDLSGIQAIDLSENSHLYDITGVRYVPELEALNLENTAVRDFSPVQGIAELRWLRLAGTEVDDIGFIGDMHELVYLDVGNCLKLKDISAAADLKHLEELRISYCGNASVWQSMPGLPQLKKLYISGYSFGGSFDLAGYPNLEVLSMADTDIEAGQLAALPNLKELDITDAVSLDGIEQLQQLETLRIGNNWCDNMRMEDLAGISFVKLPNLKELEIAMAFMNGQKLNMDIFKGLHSLESLKINGNADILIADLYPLASLNLKNLELHASFTNSKALDGIAQLYNLEHLSVIDWGGINGNGPKKMDIQNLGSLKKMKTLSLDIAAVRDYTCIGEMWDLESLQLINMRKSVVVDFLSSLTELKELELSGAGMRDFASISNLTNLRRLSIIDADILNTNFINNLEHLECLNLEINPSNRKPLVLEDLNFLKFLPNLKELDVSSRQLADIAGLHHAHALLSLDMEACVFDGNLEPLSGLRSLERLILTDTEIQDIEPLAGLSHLEYLKMDACRFLQACNFEAEGFKTLRSVYLNKSYLPSIAWLKNAEQLRIADISTARISDLSAFSSLRNLFELYAENVYGMTDVSGVAGLKNLRELDLCGCKKLEDIKAVGTLPKLQKLYMDNCTSLTDLHPVYSLESLQALSLNNLRIEDLEGISGLTALQELSCKNSLVSDVSPLSALGALKVLDLNSTLVKDIHGLSGCENLGKVCLENTEVNSVLDLKGLPLEELCVKNTGIRDLYGELMQFTETDLYFTVYCSKGMLKKKQIKALKKKIPSSYYMIDTGEHFWGVL